MKVTWRIKPNIIRKHFVLSLCVVDDVGWEKSIQWSKVLDAKDAKSAKKEAKAYIRMFRRAKVDCDTTAKLNR